MGGKSGSQVIGYKYFFGIHMGICRGPVDQLVEIKVGDRSAWPGDNADPNAIVAALTSSERDYPPEIVIDAPAPEGTGPNYSVTFEVESPSTYVPGVVVTIEHLVRYVPGFVDPLDLSGDYTIVARSDGVIHNDEGGYYIEGASFTIDIGSNPTVITKWNEFTGAGTSIPDDITFIHTSVHPLAVDNTAMASGRIFINSPELFGGEMHEGGIKGPMDIMMGEPTQVCGPDLKKMLGGSAPGFRGMFTVFFDGLISSLNPYPKAWKFRVRRSLKGWDGDVWQPDLAVIKLTSNLTAFVKNVVSVGENGPHPSPAEGSLYVVGTAPLGAWAGNANALARYSSGAWSFFNPQNGWVVYAINESKNYEFEDGEWRVAGDPDIHAMNPAHIIYECLTNRAWGRGLPRSKLDDASFVAAATALYTESFGMCTRWTRRDTIESFVQNVLNTIGATLYEDRTTAKLVLKLIRGGYNVDDLPLFDGTSGLVELRQADVTMGGSYVNEVRVKFVDPVTDQERTVRVDNLASLQANGGEFNSIERNYPGIPTPQLASRVAQRDLRAAGIELRRFNVILDRRAWQLVPGSVFRIRDLPNGVRETVVRAGKIEYGTITDGKITVTAIQDVFGLPDVSFVDPVPTKGGNSFDPCVGDFELFEIPYFLLTQALSAGDIAALDPAAGFLGVVAERGEQRNKNYDIATRHGLPEEVDQPVGTSDFCGFRFQRWKLDGTACHLEPLDAQAELLAAYNASTGHTWTVAPDYPKYDASGNPLSTKFTTVEIVPVTLLKWRDSINDPFDTGNYRDTYEELLATHLAYWIALPRYTGFGALRDVSGGSSGVDFYEPFTTVLFGLQHTAHVQAEVHALVRYGYAGDSDPPGFYDQFQTVQLYQFEWPTTRGATIESPEFFFQSCEDA